MGKGAEEAPAPPRRRRTPDRITGRTAAPGTVTEPATPTPPSTPTAGAVFYDKGAATAANFRPSYWTYDQPAPAETPVPAVPEDEATRVADIAPEPVPTRQHAAAQDRDEPPAVVGAPLDSAGMADELAATIEHVLGSRYAGTRPAVESAPPPRRLGSAVTADSLMAELAAARQARSSDHDNARQLPKSSRVPRKAASLLDRLFAVGGIALVLFALLALSPWRDSLPLPSITHFFG
jgi:hypothetical protein